MSPEYSSFRICKMRRRPNFSVQELDVMLDYLYHHHGMVTGSPCDTLLTSNDHRHFWDLMAHKVNLVGRHHRSGRELRFKWRDLKYKVKLKTTASALEYGKLSQADEKILAILQKGETGHMYSTSQGKVSSQNAFLESPYIGDEHSNDSSAAQPFYEDCFPPPSSSLWTSSNQKQVEEQQQYTSELCSNSSTNLLHEKELSKNQEELNSAYQESTISMQAGFPEEEEADPPVVQLLKKHADEQMVLRNSMSKVEALLTKQVTLMHQMLALSTKKLATEEKLVTLLEENRLMLVPKGS